MCVFSLFLFFSKRSFQWRVFLLNLFNYQIFLLQLNHKEGMDSTILFPDWIKIWIRTRKWGKKYNENTFSITKLNASNTSHTKIVANTRGKENWISFLKFWNRISVVDINIQSYFFHFLLLFNVVERTQFHFHKFSINLDLKFAFFFSVEKIVYVKCLNY